MKYYSEETVKQMLKDTKVKTLTKNEYGNIVQDFRIVRPKIKDYPSIETPDGHGNLKDSGDLYERLYSLRTFPHWDYSTIVDKVIESAPTIVEAEE